MNKLNLTAPPANEDEKQAMLDKLATLLPGSVPDADPSTSMEASVDDQSEADTLSDDEVMAIINFEQEQGRVFVQDEISMRAAKSNEYYLMQPTRDLRPPETKGRSDFVDSSVADTINWLLPPLMQVFSSTEEIVEFCAKNPEHEDAATQTTALVNYVFKVQNKGYDITRTWIHDALMQPGAIIKVHWEENSTQETTMYRGLTDLQFALIAQDPSVVVIKHRIYQDPTASRQAMAAQLEQAASGQMPPAMQPPMPMSPPGMLPQGAQANPHGIPPGAPMPQGGPAPAPQQPPVATLHDVVVVKQAKGGKVKIVNIPLEEFYVSPNSRTIEDGYSAHAVRYTIGALRAMGFDEEILTQLETIAPTDPLWTETYAVRTELQGTFANRYLNDNLDPTMREVLVVENYLKMDYNKTGIPEWRKIITASKYVLSNEPVDGPPFILIVSNPLPHLLFGVSTAEQAQGVQKNNTQIMRSMIDNISYSANAQLWVIPDNVEMDDVLDSTPGGIVRVKDGNSIGAIQQGSGDIQGATTLMQILDTVKQERTGVQKLTNGSDADIVNATASGQKNLQERAQQRVDLMVRQFVETGFKPLALRIQKLIAQHQDQYMTIRLNGKFVSVDPQAAANQYDLNTNVGLGTGDKSKTISNLQQILQMQMQAAQSPAPMSNPQLILNTVEKIVKAMGYAAPQEFFTQPPPPQPPAPPPQDPKLVQIQAQHASDMAEINRQGELDAMRAQNDLQSSLAKTQAENELKRENMYLQAAIDREANALKNGVSPAEENVAFQSTYNSTIDTVTRDDLLKAIIAAPEPIGGNTQHPQQAPAQAQPVPPVPQDPNGGQQ